MKNPVLLEYLFLFDASETFQHLYEFNKTLVDFFESKGFIAKAVKTIDGSTTRHLLVINKKEITMPVNVVKPEVQGKSKQPLEQLNALRNIKKK